MCVTAASHDCLFPSLYLPFHSGSLNSRFTLSNVQPASPRRTRRQNRGKRASGGNGLTDGAVPASAAELRRQQPLCCVIICAAERLDLLRHTLLASLLPSVTAQRLLWMSTGCGGSASDTVKTTLSLPVICSA